MKNKQSPSELAIVLLKKFSISKAPVPVDRVAKSLGAKIRYSALDDEISGMIFIHDGEPIIGINSLHHLHRQRFSIAHEIGHLQMHHDKLAGHVHVDKRFQIPMLLRDAVSATATDRLEIEANQFAAELLMPQFLLDSELRKQSIEIDDDMFFSEVANKFKVSRQALENRLMNLSYR